MTPVDELQTLIDKKELEVYELNAEIARVKRTLDIDGPNSISFFKSRLEALKGRQEELKASSIIQIDEWNQLFADIRYYSGYLNLAEKQLLEIKEDLEIYESQRNFLRQQVCEFKEKVATYGQVIEFPQGKMSVAG